jgi:hypothetical protein
LLPHAAALLFVSLLAVRGTERKRLTAVSRCLENAPPSRSVAQTLARCLTKQLAFALSAMPGTESAQSVSRCSPQSLVASRTLRRPMRAARSGPRLQSARSYHFPGSLAHCLPCVAQRVRASPQSPVAPLRPSREVSPWSGSLPHNSSPFRSLPFLAQSLSLSLPRQHHAVPFGWCRSILAASRSSPPVCSLSAVRVGHPPRVQELVRAARSRPRLQSAIVHF